MAFDFALFAQSCILKGGFGRLHLLDGDLAMLLRLGILAVFAAAASAQSALPEKVEFNRHIRRTLQDNCFKCHGPDEETRQGGLRLDTFADATREGAIVPGNSEASGIIQRILSDDPEERMPPPEFGKSLSGEQVALLRKWIDQGAVYQQHWAFVKPVAASLPTLRDSSWPKNEIDHFVAARHEAEGINHSPEADPYTLIRRVSLDLTGLPPTPEEVAAFVGDENADAYERLVERLLASPRFGERWARLWLDMARYADTKGYEKDAERTVWPYRDWVIKAFNNDMPFDQFTVEQLAGDLLPNPSEDQIIATAFHRLTMSNDEGGTDDEEFRTAAVVDRVNTTMEAWMGITMACVQCHSHKYDPITHREYYQFYAFLNQTADKDTPDDAPTMAVPDAEQRENLARLSTEIADLRAQLATKAAELKTERAQWEEHTRNLGEQTLSFGPWHLLGPIAGDDPQVLLRQTFPAERKADLETTYPDNLRFVERADLEDGKVHPFEAGVAAFVLARKITTAVDRPITLYFGSNDAIRVRLNGRQIHLFRDGRKAAPDQDKIIAQLAAGDNWLTVKLVNFGGECGFYFRAEDGMDPALLAALQTPEGQRTAEQSAIIDAQFIAAAPELADIREQLAARETELKAVEEKVARLPILRELPEAERRTTRVLLRGNFLTPGDEVTPEVPAAFHPFPADAPRNRLGLAQWLVSRENPLTARVMVNRFWDQFFGIGLVETSEDFGVQGELPTHPELLDWLAVHFMDSGWRFKELCRTIVTSATYRQSSRITPSLLERDPYNRLLARGPRFRLEAEIVRDQALAVAGLLSPKMYGPSVMPYQPEGVWQVVYSGSQWKTSPGEDAYRRGLYTFWRRTAPYPSMVTFDAPSREVCEVKRVRTNTPLQALVTLNDPAYIEAAQGLARRVLQFSATSLQAQIDYAFRSVLARPPKPQESKELAGLIALEAERYRNAPDAAAALAGTGQHSDSTEMDAAMLAAWTVAANVLLNLDETLTKS